MGDSASGGLFSYLVSNARTIPFWSPRLRNSNTVIDYMNCLIFRTFQSIMNQCMQTFSHSTWWGGHTASSVGTQRRAIWWKVWKEKIKYLRSSRRIRSIVLKYFFFCRKGSYFVRRNPLEALSLSLFEGYGNICDVAETPARKVLG